MLEPSPEDRLRMPSKLHPAGASPPAWLGRPARTSRRHLAGRGVGV